MEFYMNHEKKPKTKNNWRWGPPVMWMLVYNPINYSHIMLYPHKPYLTTLHLAVTNQLWIPWHWLFFLVFQWYFPSPSFLGLQKPGIRPFRASFRSENRSAPPGFVERWLPRILAPLQRKHTTRRCGGGGPGPGPGPEKSHGFFDWSPSWCRKKLENPGFLCEVYIIQRPSWKNSINSISTLNLFRGYDFMWFWMDIGCVFLVGSSLGS